LKPELHAALFFLGEQQIAQVAPFGKGNVNDTYCVTLASGEQRILQRVNPAVFPDPLLVIRNIVLVTDHLRRLMPDGRQEKTFQPVILYPGRSGYAFRDKDGSAWRMMHLIKAGRTCRTITSPTQAMELGRMLGLFHALLRTLDPETLVDTLPGFHYTPGYLARYDRVCSGMRQDAAAPDTFCHESIEKRRGLAYLLEERRDRLSSGIIHGDPKVDNFLFDPACEKVISLIDLDTVRPGLFLHDLGDAMRSCCNPAGEAPDEPADACFDLRLCTAWLQGYFSMAGNLLTVEDRECVVDGVSLITFELGLRFYTDYLEGNRYFKVSRPEQNLLRALTQFHLAESIDRQRDQLAAVVTDLWTAGKQ
jgi:hypothetical protein